MCQHETKSCARCQSPFECKVGNITQCHCTHIRLTEDERAYIASQYSDCLCGPCLAAVTKESHTAPAGQRRDLFNSLQAAIKGQR